METDGRGFDTAVECGGNVEAWRTAVSAARRGGNVLLFGGCPSGTQFEIETSRMHYDDLTLISPFHFGTDAVKTARNWLLDERFCPGPLISSEAKLEEAPRVFEQLRDRKEIKVAFMP